MTEMEAKSVVIDARRRHGVPEAHLDLSDAGRPNVGTVHGRLYLNHLLTKDQWDAAEWYLGKRLEWLRSIDAKHVTYTPGEAKSGSDPDAYSKWCEAIKESWSAVSECLQQASVDQRSPIISALDTILVRNMHVDHMVGDLRVGLNALNRKFLSSRRQAA